MAKRATRYITVRRVDHDHVTYEPNTVFPDNIPPEQLQALLDCGAIALPGEPPKPAPELPRLIDEPLPDGDANRMSRDGQ